MAKLKSRSLTPPGGWKYKQPETGAELKAENQDALITLVVDHRTYKGLTPTDRESVRFDIERQICLPLGYHECKPDGPDDRWQPQDGSKPVLTMSGVLAFSRAALEFVKSGMKLVPFEEAQRRAKICEGCFQNRAMTGCACGNYHAIVAAAVPESRKIESLKVCWACGCDLKSKVNLEESVILASNKGRRDLNFPDFCWQKAIEDKAKA